MALSKQLEVITLEGMRDKSYYPSGGGGPNDPPNPCWHCSCSNHEKCTGVECYRCPKEFHPRLPGVASTMERATGKTVGR